MANNDELFDGVGFAIGIQAAFGTPNQTIAALASGGSFTVADGIVQGDAESGDADSGVTLPSLDVIAREVARVAGSFTEQADAFLRAAVNGFSISFPLQGNGVTATTPIAGEATPYYIGSGLVSDNEDVGLGAIFQSLGLGGAQGTTPVFEYTPRATTVYSTIKLWHGDLSFVFTDCLVDTGSIVFTPGGNGIMTANVNVGTHDPAGFVDSPTDTVPYFADGVTFPTFDYGLYASTAAPTIEGVAHTWGEVRGFETLTVNIANTIEEFGDSNVASTGTRLSQTRRVITVDGTLYVETADSDFEYQNLYSTSAPTEDLSFQVGTVAGAADVINAYKVEVNNLQSKSNKYNRIGTAMVVELSGAKATSTTAGTEFKLTFN